LVLRLRGNKHRGINFIKFYKMWQVTSIFFSGVSEKYVGFKSSKFQTWLRFSSSSPFFISFYTFSFSKKRNSTDCLAEENVFMWSKRVEPSNVESLIADFILLEMKLNEVCKKGPST
jgi:hypothetical protein